MADPRKYTVGWICALSLEFDAAQALLDEEHDEIPPVAQRDDNSYALGSIGKHNIVLAVLPDGEYGLTSATAVARNMLHSFPNVRIGLMVGIGGGAPSLKHDIRLGDVVVSRRDGGKGGVFQYDYGKAVQNKVISFQYTDFLDQPPMALRTAVAALKSKHKRKGHQLNTSIEEALRKWPRLEGEYSRPPLESDRLYKSDVVHPDSSKECATVCDSSPDNLVSRTQRGERQDNPAIHYGLVASANTLMKDVRVRDRLAADNNVLCFEMEAAGLMNQFPCLVIRGICDYADSHKNKEWQGYAAMVAAAYAKELLHQVPPNKVEAERPILEILGKIEHQIEDIHQTSLAIKAGNDSIRSGLLSDKIENWLRPPDPSTNANHARELRQEGTGAWLLQHPVFQSWKAGTRQHVWLHGLAGCGKTVLSTTLLDHLEKGKDRVVLSFFFDFSDASKQTVNGMLRSLAFQLYRTMTASASYLDALYRTHLDGHKQPSMKELVDVVCEMLASHKSVAIILDALDESIERDDLLSNIEAIISRPQSRHVQLICTSRPEAKLQRDMPKMIGEENCLTLDKTAVNGDIRSYVVAQLGQHRDFIEKRLSQDLLKQIQSKVGDGADGMFRWAFCQLDTLARCPHITAIREALKSLPRSLDETYNRMLDSIPAKKIDDSFRLLQFLVHSKRPLRLAEATEIIATQIEGEVAGSFNVENRLFRETDILDYCPGLVVVVHADVDELHLSHFSVKEYLLGISHIKLSTASISITMTCLAYLTGIKGSQAEIRNNFPMARFAAEIWTGFAASAEPDGSVMNAVVGFLLEETTFQRWCRLYQQDKAWKDDPGHPYGSRLYYACLGGLARTAKALLEKDADINARGGRYGNALQAASLGGHAEVVKLLVEKGANINAQGGRYSNALQAASSGGHAEIVKLLVENDP
ncbi:hypothetical protein Micbo1qcDRAFT_219483 [Microdochium bolleyi]|uniref:NACHT domain-containing protein n=1 Tax=Microdochium bolleyi TaxID=196109 RepID=A0A136INE5_9PEZI|nr:hypothetical protein Micbo1qcDRAFT_219483 [Microdochium bolleyi]